VDEPQQELDLGSASREQLIGLIIELRQIATDQQKIIAKQAKRIAELEDHLGLGGGSKSAPISIKSSRQKTKSDSKSKRKPRHLSCSRKRETPTRLVDHKPQRCPDCGRKLSGGSPWRSRQVIDFAPAPAEVTEHVLHECWCGVCNKKVRASVDFSVYVSGQRRIGHNLAAWIAYLNTEARMGIRPIQALLKQLCSVHLSIGEIVGLLKLVARKAETTLESIKQEIRSADCVHSDETAWRQNGEYRCLWSLSTTTARWFHIDMHRSAEVIIRLIGEHFQGILVTDFYCVYNKILGKHQRCWPHFHRDLEELRLHPQMNPQIEEWIDAILNLWHQGRQYRQFCLTKPRFGASVFDRRRKRRKLEAALTALVEPYWEADKETYPQATLARRAGIFMNELFTFVEYPFVSDDNNAAERAIRPAVIMRKICGGTRSDCGTQVKAALMSIFATWKVRGLNPIDQCRAILIATT
jgi:transposase